VEIWERKLGVHAKGGFLGSRTAIPAMRKGGGGSIINTSSVMGIVGSSLRAMVVCGPSHRRGDACINTTTITVTARSLAMKQSLEGGPPRG
jgi:NAD(P)-dependent dehydrogenase (short-subunit alcohol dehydrogenase family)